ncbi:hypothetical protein NliqN6_2666 [Naganishia liquefaciens]|uniref:Protein PBN1 n=1 Tax=Naganishia liquefaciens TaxID=104408 RepID=A0A8H3TSL0_9TREE|nr:hypothetical protein NliqN6_2666 [Naganishia liquefaciens]
MSYMQPTTYEAYFSYPALIHPTLHLRVNSSTAAHDANASAPSPLCTLCTTVYMNDRLFIDPFELKDRWGSRNLEMQREFERNDDDSKGGEIVTRTSFPCGATETLEDLKSQASASIAPMGWSLDPKVPDLERPVRYHFQRELPPPRRIYKPNQVTDDPDHPFEAVLRIHTPFEPFDVDRRVEIGIPTHMRYQEPSTSHEAYRIVTLGDIASSDDRPKDLLFEVSWNCRRTQVNDSAISHDQSDMRRLSLASPSMDTRHEIALPTGIASHVQFVPPITFVVVLLSWLYVARALLRLWRRSSSLAAGKTQ